jgi:hypothetical protein
MTIFIAKSAVIGASEQKKCRLEDGAKLIAKSQPSKYPFIIEKAKFTYRIPINHFSAAFFKAWQK